MIENIEWFAVAVAALVTFVVGGPWYSPAMFLKAWQEDMNLTDTQPGHPARVFGLAYVFSFLSCALLAALMGPGAGVLAGFKLGLLVGVCFVAASFGINYQFANRSLKALFIDGGYHTVQFAGFGAVLGAWPFGM
ncbi:MAG: DUF1761 domain-containing protein [Woeseia sp.]|nr:DUF1761 domain-containing protein [Woeseia sp.]